MNEPTIENLSADRKIVSTGVQFLSKINWSLSDRHRVIA